MIFNNNIIEHLLSFLWKEKSFSDNLPKYIGQGYVVGLLVFILYLEVSPSLGGIWFRKNNKGVRKMNFLGLFHYLTAPFYDKQLWDPKIWDVNVIIFTSVFTISYVSFRYILSVC